MLDESFSSHESSCLTDDQLAYFLEETPSIDLSVFEQHIDRCSHCQQLLLLVFSRHKEIRKGTSTVLTAGTKVQRYTILRHIGTGGMGTVYLAHDPQLDRRVAIKILHRNLFCFIEDKHNSLKSNAVKIDAQLLLADVESNEVDRDKSYQQLKKEGQIMAKIRHPHVLQVYEIGEFEKNLFIVTPYLEGETLDLWLAKKPKTLKEIVRIFCQIAEGLHTAHQAHVVHGDFKPKNVMVTAGDQACIVDFGLSLSVEQSITESKQDPYKKSWTSVFNVLSLKHGGTPAYLSPEQFRCENKTAKSDQFSFSVALYEAVTGYLPFKFTNTLHNKETNNKNGDFRVDWSSTKITKPLRLILERGMSSDPTKRYENMESLRQDLLKITQPKRRKYLDVLLFLFVFLFLGFVFYHQYLEPRYLCQRGESQINLVWNESIKRQWVSQHQAIAHQDTSFSMWNFLTTQISDIAQEWAQSYESICRATTIDKTQSEVLFEQRMSCLENHKKELSAVLQIAADEKVSFDTLREGIESLPRPRSCLANQLHLTFERVPHRENDAALNNTLTQAKAYFRLGQFQKAELVLKPFIEWVKEQPPHPMDAEVLFYFGLIQYNTLKNQRGISYFIRALEIAETFGLDELSGNIAAQISNVESYNAHFEQALQMTGFVKAKLKRLGNPVTLEIDYLKSMVLLEKENGHFKEADEYLTRAILLQEQNDPPINGKLKKPFQLMVLYRMQTMIAIMKSEYQHAIDIAESAEKKLRPYFPEKDLALRRLKDNLTHAYLSVGRTEEGIALARQNVLDYQSLHADNDSGVAIMQAILASALAQNGNLKEAGQIFSMVQKRIEKREIEVDALTFTNWLTALADINMHLGQPEEAKKNIDQAMEVFIKNYGQKNLQGSEIFLNLAEISSDVGNLKDAESALSWLTQNAILEFKDDTHFLSVYHLAFGKFYRLKKNSNSAIFHFRKSLAFREQNGSYPSELAKIRLELAKTLKSAHLQMTESQKLAQLANEFFCKQKEEHYYCQQSQRLWTQ